MYKFIVEASSDVSPPTYLENATDFMKLQLQNGEEKYFSPLLEDKWPSSEELGLDPNQFIAFQAAITKQFAIIQGPPGTGKTFLGNFMSKVFVLKCLYTYLHLHSYGFRFEDSRNIIDKFEL